MIEKIREVREAVKNKTYIAALALALTLPDICGQVENGASESNKSYYIHWIDKYMDNEAFSFPLDGFDTQTFKGNMCYSLRCKLLHSGNVDVKSKRLGVDVDEFILVKPDSPQYYHGFQYKTVRLSDGTEKKTTIIGVDYLCEVLCSTAEDYYNKHPNKALFDEHTFDFE